MFVYFLYEIKLIKSYVLLWTSDIIYQTYIEFTLTQISGWVPIINGIFVTCRLAMLERWLPGIRFSIVFENVLSFLKRYFHWKFDSLRLIRWLDENYKWKFHRTSGTRPHGRVLRRRFRVVSRRKRFVKVYFDGNDARPLKKIIFRSSRQKRKKKAKNVYRPKKKKKKNQILTDDDEENRWDRGGREHNSAGVVCAGRERNTNLRGPWGTEGPTAVGATDVDGRAFRLRMNCRRAGNASTTRKKPRRPGDVVAVIITTRLG